MGRIKTTLLKRVTNKLVREHGSEFKTDFESNKEILDKFLDLRSKKFRNVIAGYITRLKRQKSK